MKQLLILITCILFTQVNYAQSMETIYVWPNKVPGEKEEKHEPIVSENNARNVVRLSKVTNPALKVFRPSNSNNNGAAVIICPGGGYNILAIDLEGYEIAQWLSELGFTAFVLQYRVPKKTEGALNDIQRSLKIVRSNSKNWGINSNKIGVLGFSAGGSLAARASTIYKAQSYDKIDIIDNESSKPDFSVLVYPAYLDRGDNRSLTPELTIDQETPPMFIFATSDDSHANSALVMAANLRDAKVPVELHLLPEGGHGYGLRKGNIAGETWPILAEKWLLNQLK